MLYYRTQDDIVHFIPPAVDHRPGTLLPPGRVQVSSGQVPGADGAAPPVAPASSTPAPTRPVVEGTEDIEAAPEEPMPVPPTPGETQEQRIARLKLERRAHLINAAAMLMGIAAGFWMDRRS